MEASENTGKKYVHSEVYTPKTAAQTDKRRFGHEYTQNDIEANSEVRICYIPKIQDEEL